MLGKKTTMKENRTKDIAEIDGLVKTTDYFVGEFRTKMSLGIEAIKSAAEIYVYALRAHPTNAHKAFSDAFPAVSQQSWETLRMIGNGDVNPMAFLLPRMTVKKIASIPIEKQNKIFSESARGFKVYDPVRRNERVIPIAELTSQQVDILFDVKTGRIRDVSEQEAIVKVATKRAAEIVENQPNYIVNGKTLVVMRNTTIGIKELKRILCDMGEEVK